MRWVKQTFPYAVLLVAIWAGWKFVFPLFRPQAEEMDIQTTTVQRGDLRDVVPADGVIEPAVLVEVKSKASGVVEKVVVEPGQHVKAGDVLVELDRKQLLADLRQAEADLRARRAQFKLTARSLTPQQREANASAIRQAELALQQAEEGLTTQQAAHDRIVELHAKGYATQAELDDVRNALTNAQNAVEQARERLDQARKQAELDQRGAEPEEIEVARASIVGAEADVENLREELSYTTVRAPISGTVLSRPVELGTAVASGTRGNTEGTVIATIGDLSTLYVKAQIEETDIAKVREGIACRISFDAHSGWIWLGRVTKVYPYPQQGQQGQDNFNNNSAARYPVDIAIDLASGHMDSDAPRAMGDGGWVARMTGGGGRGRGGGGGGRGGRGGGGRGGQAAGERAEAPPERPKSPELLPRMTATAEIVLEDHPDVIWIPTQFVKYEKGEPFVEVITGGKAALDKAREAGDAAGKTKARANQKLNDKPEAKLPRERRSVKVGYSDGVRIEVTEGLKEEDVVYLERPIKDERFR